MNQVQTVTATWARTHFGEIIRGAMRSGNRFVVERDSIPAVVILSKSEYDRLERQAAWSRFQELSQQASHAIGEEDLGEEEVHAEIEAIKWQVFNERYANA